MNYPNIKRSLLSNGMILITENNPRANSLSLGFWVKAGSVSEKDSEHGVAHFVEHMMFKGTKNRSPLQIAREVEKVGGELNAFTDRETICYHTLILAQDLHVALGLFSDILQNSTFPDAEIKKERDVIIEEIKMYEDSPEDLVIDLLYETMFSKQAFGRSIIGTRKSLKKINRDTLWQFYKRTHSPENIFVT
jgi:predicted Zn-dependent peptidase